MFFVNTTLNSLETFVLFLCKFGYQTPVQPQAPGAGLGELPVAAAAAAGQAPRTAAGLPCAPALLLLCLCVMLIHVGELKPALHKFRPIASPRTLCPL